MSGYVQRIYSLGPMVGSAILTPLSKHRLMVDDSGYVEWAVETDRTFSEMLQEAKQQNVNLAWLAVPLVDPEEYLRWCLDNQQTPSESSARAMWAAHQVAQHTHYEGEMPVVSGLMPLQQPGDLLCVAMILAAGWRGDEVSPTPADIPPPGWSRLRLWLGDDEVSVAILCDNPCRLLARVLLGRLALSQGGRPQDGLPHGGYSPHGHWKFYSAGGTVAIWYRS